MNLDEFELVFRSESRYGPHTIRSPIRYEVWREFALHPGARVDLLLEPEPTASPQRVAPALLDAYDDATIDAADARVAIADDVVATNLTFVEFLRGVVPLTSWARHLKTINRPRLITTRLLVSQLEVAVGSTGSGASGTSARDRISQLPRERVEEFRWFVLLAARIGTQSRDAPLGSDDLELLAQWLRETLADPPESTETPVAFVSVNRVARTSVRRSRTTVKADAAARVFEIDASEIGWAVLDSGINARHLAFRRHNPTTGLPYDEPFEKGKRGFLNRTRVHRTFDLVNARDRLQVTSRADLDAFDIGARINKDCYVLATPNRYRPPQDIHGTHVAGVLGANWTHQSRGQPGRWSANPEPLIGVCPTVSLWDFRVLGADGTGDEFSILTALNHVLRINAEAGRLVIHGVNLSLSIPHDVANYACGWTPICEACDRLVANGVVVVAAAGNTGFRALSGRRLADGTTYLPISITDPGNANSVITVGSTHRDLPYRYGVSYFSSRGPTADVRRKPDLLAPGEGITAPVGEDDYTQLDGTSQAAPHVSGAAALLLARYPELIGQPIRVKQILCDSANDLGRDPAFQGHGLVDILRALQSI